MPALPNKRITFTGSSITRRHVLIWYMITIIVILGWSLTWTTTTLQDTQDHNPIVIIPSATSPPNTIAQDELIPLPNFTRRFWMASEQQCPPPQPNHTLPPWKWTATSNYSLLGVHTCEFKTLCRPHLYYFGDRTSNPPLPRFTYRNNAFRLHTLYEVLTRLNATNHGNTTRVAFVGDSTLEDAYESAKCHFVKTGQPYGLRVTRKTRRIRYLTSQLENTIAASGGWMTYVVSDWFTTINPHYSREFVFSFVRSNAVTIDLSFLKKLFTLADLIVFQFGLHYAVKSHHRILFEGQTSQLFDMMARMRVNTPIFWLTPVAQHFNVRDGMYSEPPRQRHNISAPPPTAPYGTVNVFPCMPFSAPLEDVEWVTPILRRVVQQRMTAPFMLDFLSMGSSHHGIHVYSNDSHNDSTITPTTLHIIPWFDITASLWDYHKSRVSHVADCTHHIRHLTNMYDGIWDAMWRVVVEDSGGSAWTEKQQDDTPPAAPPPFLAQSIDPCYGLQTMSNSDLDDITYRDVFEFDTIPRLRTVHLFDEAFALHVKNITSPPK